MANILIGAGVERTHTYKGILQADVGANTYQYKLIQDMSAIIDDTELDRDRIDDGSPVFTGTGDVIGNFDFTLKGSVDLTDANAAPTNAWLLSHWQYQLSIRTPAEVAFIQTFEAPDSVGNDFTRLRFTGRIMSAGPDRQRERGVDEVVVSGEIIAFTSFLRAAS